MYYKHGLSRTPEYATWNAMRHRCSSPKQTRYHGRGLTVCDEWLGIDGLRRFVEHVGPRPGPGYSIDRIDNDRGYEPGNVRWTSRKEQARNRATTTLLNVYGSELSLTQWSELTGVSIYAMRGRIKAGLPPHEVVRANRPRTKRKGATFKHGNKTATVAEWSAMTGIPQDSIRRKLKHGVTFAEALNYEGKARGSRVGNAKFSEKDVVEMRRLREQGVTLVALSKRFRTSRSNVDNIVNRRTWKHVS